MSEERERKTFIFRPLKRRLLSVLFYPFSWALFARSIESDDRDCIKLTRTCSPTLLLYT
jgi:hypothetical protein